MEGAAEHRTLPVFAHFLHHRHDRGGVLGGQEGGENRRVLGFGAGSLIFAPLIEKLLGNDPALYDVTLQRTFIILGIAFLIFVIGAAQVFAVPPAGYKPEGWTPAAAATTAAGAAIKAEFAPGEMIKT